MKIQLRRTVLYVSLSTVIVLCISFNSFSSSDKSPPGNQELQIDETSGSSEAAAEEAVILDGDNRPERLKIITKNWKTNWNRRTIEYSELRHGGPQRDGIPSIDRPVFISTGEAGAWLKDNEPVISFELGGDTRAYPLQILIWHEIVNDTVGGIPVLITFCPLCNSSIVFDRRVGGAVYEFGTSGLLRNSDLVMYDRTTESLWQQFSGLGIVGDLAGTELLFLPSSIVSFREFREQFPNGNVLSRDTGYIRSYGKNPYVGYDRINQSPFLFDGTIDDRLMPMERVVAITLETPDGKRIDVAYPFRVLSRQGIINDVREGIPLVVFHTRGTSSALDTPSISDGMDIGSTGVFHPSVNNTVLIFRKSGDRIVDDPTGSTWNIFGRAVKGPLKGERLRPIVHGDHFWFAWAAFKPKTFVYSGE